MAGTNFPNGIKLNGTLITSTAAEINALDGITATVTELNKLAGAGAVVASGTQASAITAIADTEATVADIATGVNAVIAALVAFGIAAEAE